MRAFLIAVIVLIAAASAAMPPKWHQLDGYSFEQFKRDFGKNYAVGSQEHHMREKLFNMKLAEIQAHNADKSQTWKKGVNRFSDWTAEERKAMQGSKATDMQFAAEQHKRDGFQKQHIPKKSLTTTLPKSVDYRGNDLLGFPVLTAVKHQGNCGSCWAHAATEQLESYWSLATIGRLFVLSTQSTTACTPNPNQCGGTGGCNGATAELGYETAMRQGLTEEWQYPYSAYWGTTGKCNIPVNASSEISVAGYAKLTANSQEEVMNTIAFTGPLAVNVFAIPFLDYESGVFTPTGNGCDYSTGNITIDHVVQMVGYGTDSTTGQDYFLIRNSWSAAWGENGYIRLLRTDDVQCGLNTPNADGVGCKGQPSVVRTCGTCGVLYDTSYPIMKHP